MKLLVGFDNEKAVHQIRQEFVKREQSVEIIQKYTKSSVLEYVSRNHDCAMVLLMENSMQGKYTAAELAKLTDVNEHLNIVLIAEASHKGTEYMRQLYSAGIYNAIFVLSEKKGVSISKIVDLLLHKRSKPDARQYYGIEQIAVEMESLPTYILEEYYAIIRNETNYGSNIGIRFSNVTRHLSAPQNAELIKNMPADLVNQLKKYEEFFDVIRQVEEYGIQMNMERPSKLERAGIQIGKNLLGDYNGKETTMGTMNFNEISGRFDGKRNSGNYNKTAFNSMPLMKQPENNSDFLQGEQEYRANERSYQQPIFTQNEAMSFDNWKPYSSPSYEGENRDNKNFKKEKSVKVAIAGCVGLVLVVVVLIGAGVVLKNRPTVIAKEQVGTNEQAEVENFTELEESVSETVAYTESDSADSVVEETVEPNVVEEEKEPNELEETAVLENATPVLLDITTIISDGSIVNQVVVDNIMMQYEDMYNFVVYGLPAVATETDTVETSDELDAEAVVEKEMTEKYYKVSLAKPGSITFTEIDLQ